MNNQASETNFIEFEIRCSAIKVGNIEKINSVIKNM